jgi:hypothetical protein
MVNRVVLLMILGVVLSLPGTTRAQQEGGDVELGLQGWYSNPVGDQSGSGVGNVTGKIGVFLTRSFELGMGPSFTFSKDATTFGSNFFLSYSFLSRKRQQFRIWEGVITSWTSLHRTTMARREFTAA